MMALPKMRKIVSATLYAFVALALVACGGPETVPTNTGAETSPTESTPDTHDAPAPDAPGGQAPDSADTPPSPPRRPVRPRPPHPVVTTPRSPVSPLDSPPLQTPQTVARPPRLVQPMVAPANSPWGLQPPRARRS